MKAPSALILTASMLCCFTLFAEEATKPSPLKLAQLKAAAEEFKGKEDHVINEENILANAAKNDAKSYSRRIYLKLPLNDVQFHWKFQEKSALLSGSLSLTIKRAAGSETLPIFQGGTISDDWEVLECCDQGPNELYFGFTSKKAYLVSENDAVTINLATDHDCKGIGPDATGTLKRGDYTSFSQFKIYHLESSTKEKDIWAFLNNDAWNIMWKLDITSHHGWMKRPSR